MTAVPHQRETGHSPVTLDDLDGQLLQILFGDVPVGVAVFDLDARLQRCNSTWTGFFTHYLGVSPDYVRPGCTMAELLPDSARTVEPLAARALAGETIRQHGIRLEQDGVVNYWDVVMAPTYRDGEVVGFVDVVTDATERIKAYDTLQRRVAALAAVASNSTLDQPIEVTLQALAQIARETTAAEACAVVIVDPETNLISVFEAAGLPEPYAEALSEAWRQGVRSPSRDALEHQQLTVVEDARARGLENPLYEPIHPYLSSACWDDMVVVPLDSRGRCLGVMQYYHRANRGLDADDRAFLTALADQAAVAVANAALYAKSEHDAALMERQRLARELHDSVSQALFSMTLHARTAERQLTIAGLGTDAPAVETVRRVAELTQGALAEMRALIFELRPGALGEEGLVTALTRQAAALTAREAMPIRVVGPDERPVLDSRSEEHLYRLTLEALNNAVKHSRATEVVVTIGIDGDALRVTVSDDGVGFDPTAPHPGHLGQTTMAERAAAVCGSLTVDSTPGRGCTVTVVVPLHS